MLDAIPNVLASRYASRPMREVWSPTRRVVLERHLWIAVLEAQKKLGIELPDGVVEAYQGVAEIVDLESIEARERVTRHDVKARIEEFCELAGHEHIHKGMTSRDLTENVEQMQVRSALEIVRDRDAVVVGVELRGIGNRGAVVERMRHTVAVEIRVAGVAEAVAVGVILLRVVDRRAVVDARRT